MVFTHLVPGGAILSRRGPQFSRVLDKDRGDDANLAALDVVVANDQSSRNRPGQVIAEFVRG